MMGEMGDECEYQYEMGMMHLLEGPMAVRLLDPFTEVDSHTAQGTWF